MRDVFGGTELKTNAASGFGAKDISAYAPDVDFQFQFIAAGAKLLISHPFGPAV
jgi:hypothetical protein